MNKTVKLSLNSESKRILLYSLEMYKQVIQDSLVHSAFQRELARYEVKVTNRLLTQVMDTEKQQRIALPTIATSVENH